MSLEIPNIQNIETTVDKIKRKELKVYDLVSEHLKRAHTVNSNINAFITILDEALDKASELDTKIANEEIDLSNNKNRLLGIPFTVKDLYLVEDTKTTFGSKLMEDYIAPYTGTVVQNCIDEGAILIAKCNCDPWGFGASGENSGYGPTKHPLDFERTPGGSSSGSAAGLLAGVGFFSLGTDTGGSVRQPANFCGLYGLKPTYGRNSRYGIGSMGSSFDTPAFFARFLEDTALLEEIMAGKDELDPSTYDIPVQKYLTKLNEFSNQDLKNIRIGIPKEFFIEGLHPDVRKEIEKAVENLKIKGAKVKYVNIPSSKYSLAVYYILVPSEISSNRAKYDGVRFGKKVSEDYEENMIRTRSKYLEDEVKRRIMIGTYSLSAGFGEQFYKKASKVRTKIKKEFDQVFEEVDVLITPVSPAPAFKLGEKSNDPVQMYLVDIFTVTANIVGIPSIAVPLGKNASGLPLGLQIMGKKFDEETILNVAKFVR